MDSKTIMTLVITAFLIINLVIGMQAGRGVKTVEDYAIGKKKWSSGALVMTYLATVIGDAYIYIIPEYIFTGGVAILIAELCFPISHLFYAYVLSKKIKNFVGCISAGDILNKLYGKKAQMIYGVMAPIYGLVVCGFQTYSIGVCINKFLGIEIFYSLLVGGIILVLYTILGGIKSVVATDIFQFLALSFCMIIIAILAILKAGGPLAVIYQIPKEHLSFFNDSRVFMYISMFVIVGVLQSGVNDPARMQRMLMAGESQIKFKNVFKKVALFEVIMLIVLSFTTYSCYILYPKSNPKEVIFTLSENLFNSGNFMNYLVCVGFISVFLSTGDSFLQSASVSFYNDFIINTSYISKKNLSPNKQLLLIRFGTLFLGILSIIFASVHGPQVRVDYVLGILAPTITAPLLLGILGLKRSSKSFWTSFISGGGICILLLSFASPLQPFAVILGMLFSFLVFLLFK